MLMKVLQEIVSNLLHFWSDKNIWAQKSLGCEFGFVHQVPKQHTRIVFCLSYNRIHIFFELRVPFSSQTIVAWCRLPVLPKERHKRSIRTDWDQRMTRESSYVVLEKCRHEGFLFCVEARAVLELFKRVSSRHP